jgi:hypothetical protein
LQSETGSRLVATENCYYVHAVQEENNPLGKKNDDDYDIYQFVGMKIQSNVLFFLEVVISIPFELNFRLQFPEDECQ